MIQADRSVSGWMQFKELFKRNLSYLLRNPASIRMTFTNAAFVALLVLALFFKTGDVSFVDDKDGSLFRKSIYNWVGVSFILCTNLLMPSV
jgi:hypothetical protein